MKKIIRKRWIASAVSAALIAVGLAAAPAAHASGTVTYDATGGARVANSATLSWSHTVSGTNTAMLVGVGVGKINDGSCVASVKYNGVAMVSKAKVHSNNTTKGFEQVFGLAGVPTGAHTVSVTVTGCTPTELTGESESFSGVDQITPFDGLTTLYFNGQFPVITTSSSTIGDIYAGFLASGHSISNINYGTSRLIENQDNSTGAGNSAAASIASTGAGVKIGWSQSAADVWGMAMIQVDAASGPSGSMSAPPGFTTNVFEDQFTGTTLDSTKWVTQLGDQGNRWNNNGLLPAPYSGPTEPNGNGQQMYAPSQVTVNNGLTINAQRNTTSSQCGSACTTYASTYPWVSGIINTEGKYTLPTTSSWYVQANIKMPDTSQGMWPALWFMCGTACSPENELDGWEGGFHELTGVAANNTGHYDYFSNSGQKVSEQDVGLDTSAAYHVYGVKFVPNNSITFYLDGVQKFQVSTATCGCTIPAEPYEIMINDGVANTQTSGWHTVPNANTPDTPMQVAEVQAWTP